jgi:acyl-CoA synthetase (NDP forming)
MSDITSLAESAANAVGKVSPFAEGFFVIVITFLGLIAWRRGEKSAKEMSVPTYLMVHDAAKAMSSIAEANQEIITLLEKNNAVLQDIAKSSARIDLGQVHTHRLLNALRNEQQLRGTMAHPTERDDEEVE